MSFSSLARSIRYYLPTRSDSSPPLAHPSDSYTSANSPLTGRAFVRNEKGVGHISLHFDETIGNYVSFEGYSRRKLDDGSQWSSRLLFSNQSYDWLERKFCGVLSYGSNSSVQGVKSQKWEIIFDSQFVSVLSGKIILTKVDGKKNTVPLCKHICYTIANIGDVVDLHDTVKRMKEEGATNDTIQYLRAQRARIPIDDNVDPWLVGKFHKDDPIVKSYRMSAGKILEIIYKRLGCDGAKEIATVLSENNTLTTINISYNNIGSDGAKDIATALSTNTNITNINMNYNKIGDAGAKQIATALSTNNTLTNINTIANIDISNNNIGDAGANEIATALSTNNTLTTINIKHNNIPSKTASLILRRIAHSDIIEM